MSRKVARVSGMRENGRGIRVAALGMIGLLTVALSACGGKPPWLDELVDDDNCRQTVLVGAPAEAVRALEDDSLRRAAAEERSADWRLPPESAEVAQLNAWCAAVGPAVVGGWGDTASLPVVDTLWLVSWNVHVGGSDLWGLVEDLRAGRLTGGRPVQDFVLLLQEAHREGELVPGIEPDEPGGSPITGAPPGGERQDIITAAERLGLWVVYVPSMRNGETEDRGNAILSTLRLRRPVSAELPVARQRRVAVAADVAGRTRDGREWRLQVSTVHLESSPSGWKSDEEQRLEQTEALLALLPEADAAVAAGDFNTKTRGRDEALVPIMRRAYPQTPRFPQGPTYQKVFGIYREYLDYMFFRLPDGARASYDRVSSTYSSDHFPLVGRVAW